MSINPKLIPGGTSSGSAAAVSAGLCDFAIGSDTGGSIRNPASHCSVTGLRPTYGSVSRYGLIDMTMSLDQIGPLTKTAEDSELIFNIIKGQDNFDTTTKNISKIRQKKQYKIGLVDVKKFCNKEIAGLIEEKARQTAEKNNYKIKKIELPLDISLETYYILVYTEFFSASRKFDGRRFGLKIDEYGGPEVIRRILGGSEISKAEYHGRYYRSALKAKNYIKQKFRQIFKDIDVLILPTVPKLPHKLGKKLTVREMYSYDVLTVPASIGGIPGISIPAGKIIQDNVKKPIGLQILAPEFSEDLIFYIAKKFEEN
jgi:aspartyl-tRNA(Asn)/glutamyl-tRNA(Gln) amidotransferase subunit A